MTWREIIDLYLSGCGSAGGDPRAAQKMYEFVSEARRRMYAHLDIPETKARKTVKTTANQDWVPVADDIYAIRWMQNQAEGFKLIKEPEGTMGRSRYFAAGTDKPPTSVMSGVTFYVREGNKVWLRDTPSEVGVLDYKYKILPAPITKDDLDSEPRLPSEYHVPMARVASGIYYSFFPPLDTTTDQPAITYGDNLIAQVFASMSSTMSDPNAEENLDHRKTMFVMGYGMGGIR